MLSALSLLVTEDAGGHGFTRPLPMPPEFYGIIAVAVVLLALLFLWLFRRTAPEPVDVHADSHGGHGRHGELGGSTRSGPAGQIGGGHH